MMHGRKSVGLVLGLMLLFLHSLPPLLHAEPIKLVVMEDRDDASRYLPLLTYLNGKGIEAGLVVAQNYIHAVKLLESGQAGFMFSDSGLAGIMIIKEVAYPLVRPLNEGGWSTLRAVVVAPGGAAEFTGSADYFRDKRVVCTGLASWGEFYLRSIEGIGEVNATVTKAVTSEAVLQALFLGAADVAIVHNRAWDAARSQYPSLALIGEPKGENPEGTLIASYKVDRNLAARVKAALLSVGEEGSPQAGAVRDSLKINRYIETTLDDFRDTLPLLVKAGVRKE